MDRLPPNRVPSAEARPLSSNRSLKRSLRFRSFMDGLFLNLGRWPEQSEFPVYIVDSDAARRTLQEGFKSLWAGPHSLADEAAGRLAARPHCESLSVPNRSRRCLGGTLESYIENRPISDPSVHSFFSGRRSIGLNLKNEERLLRVL